MMLRRVATTSQPSYRFAGWSREQTEEAAAVAGCGPSSQGMEQTGGAAPVAERGAASVAGCRMVPLPPDTPGCRTRPTWPARAPPRPSICIIMIETIDATRPFPRRSLRTRSPRRSFDGALALDQRACAHGSEGGMMRLETVIELNFSIRYFLVFSLFEI